MKNGNEHCAREIVSRAGRTEGLRPTPLRITLTAAFRWLRVGGAPQPGGAAASAAAGDSARESPGRRRSEPGRAGCGRWPGPGPGSGRGPSTRS
jgi:hypothetical protein